MFKKIKSYFSSKKESTFDPITLTNSKKVFVIKHNKELTETENFQYLLEQFKNVEVRLLYINQNVNTEILAFGVTIFECVEKIRIIHNSLVGDLTKSSRLLFRLPRDKNNGYLFFNERGTELNNKIFNTTTLNQMVGWMQDILVFYEDNKTSQEPDIEHFCNALFSRLDILYEFFFHLLCYLKNIKSENLSIVVFSDTF